MANPISYHIRKSLIRRAADLLILFGILAIVFFLGNRSNPDGFDLRRFLLLCALAAGIEIFYAVKRSTRFVRMIRRQEAATGVSFDDTDALPFSKKSPDCIAGDWFIRSGSYAFYRGCITDVRCRDYGHIRINGRRIGIRVTVNTSYGKRYRFDFRSWEDAEKFTEWSGHGVADL